MLKNLICVFILLFTLNTNTLSSEIITENELVKVISEQPLPDSAGFNLWVVKFKKKAVDLGFDKNTVDLFMGNAKFLPKVIKYDRYQPEFYEDTHTYISKRTNKNKVKKGLHLYNDKKLIIDEIEKKFSIEKELLLSLMGIETNYGKYLGKMDIISSLATLSFDQRRSAFFTKELLILLNLFDKKIVKKDILYGSWAGAHGNFQFMPRTVKDYAIDYNQNNIIELRKTEDSFASAANYLKKMGWKKNSPCFTKIELKDNIPKKYLNASARNIDNKKKVKFFREYIKKSSQPEVLLNVNQNLLAAIVTPDKDIVPNSSTYVPAYLVYSNYEIILNWNRSLRFALAVCTLMNNIKNEI